MAAISPEEARNLTNKACNRGIAIVGVHDQGRIYEDSYSIEIASSASLMCHSASFRHTTQADRATTVAELKARGFSILENQGRRKTLDEIRQRFWPRNLSELAATYNADLVTCVW